MIMIFIIQIYFISYYILDNIIIQFIFSLHNQLIININMIIVYNKYNLLI